MHDELATTPLTDPRALPVAEDVVRAPSPSAGLNARSGSLRRLVVVSDALALVLAFLLSGLVSPSVHVRSASVAFGLVLFAATLPAWLVGARLTGLYRLEERRASGGGVEEWLSIGRLMVIGTWVVLAIAWLARFEQPETARLVVFAALAVTFVASGRAAARALARRRSAYVQNAVIVGAGEVGQLVARKLLRHPEYGVNLVGFVDTPPKRWRRDSRAPETALSTHSTARSHFRRLQNSRASPSCMVTSC